VKNYIKIIAFLFFLSSVSWAACAGCAGNMQTLHEINEGLTTDCSGSIAGWYNDSDKSYADANSTRAIRITFTGLANSDNYYLFYKTLQKADGATTATGSVVPFAGGASLGAMSTNSSNNIFTSDASSTTYYVEITHAEIASYSLGDAAYGITFGISDEDVASTAVYATGNSGSSSYLIYDVTLPTISTAVNATTNATFGTGGTNIAVTGTGFNGTDDSNTARNTSSWNAYEGLYIDTDKISSSITYTSSTVTTVTTINTGSDYGGTVYYWDNACNKNASGPTYRHDDTAPTFSSVSAPVVKAEATATVSGGGFDETSPQTGIKTITIGGSTLGTSAWEINNANTITITGPNSTFSAGVLAFTDSAGNTLTTGTSFAVDVTAPAITGITISNSAAAIAKSGQTVKIAGSAGGWETNGTPTIKIEDTAAGGNLFSVDETDDAYITIVIGTNNTAENTAPTVIVTDAAGNASSDGGPLDIDNRVPTVTGVATEDRYIKSGGTAVVSGTGFASTDGGTITDGQGSGNVHLVNTSAAAQDLVADLGGSWGSVTATSLTITAAGTECKDCYVKVTDYVGNASTATSHKVTIDNTLPTISGLTNVANTSGVTQVIAKSGDEFDIDGDHYSDGAPTAPSTTAAFASLVTIGGSPPTGMSWVYGTDTDAKLVVTAGSGEFADGVVVVTDASGNASTTTTHKVTIDNTAPTNITLTAGGSNHDQTATVFKNGDILWIRTTSSNPATFVNDGFTAAAAAVTDPTVWLGGTNMTNYATVVAQSATEIKVTFNQDSNVAGALTVKDAAGNESASAGTIYLDNEIPANMSITNPARKSGAAATITTTSTGTTNGHGFQTGGIDATVAIAGNPTVTTAVTADATLTITAGTGDYEDVAITITDPAGNASTQSIKMTIDNTAPTIDTISVPSIKEDGPTVIAGGGFYTQVAGTDDGTDVDVYVGGQYSASAYFSISVTADNSLTITGGTGDITNGDVYVADRAGNWSSAKSNLDIDNTAPTVSDKSVASVKTGSTVTISGEGFTTGTNEPSKVEIGSLDATNDGNDGNDDFSVNWDDLTNSALIVTASAGNVTDGQIKVTDYAGNTSTSTVAMHIDNTLPTVSTVTGSIDTYDIIRNGTDATIGGTGLTIGTSVVTKIQKVEVGGKNLVTELNGSFTVNSATGLTITGGNTEVTEGNVVVTDSAGNASTDTGKLLTIDNTPPVLTSVVSTKGNNIVGDGHGRTAQAKSGDTFKIVASGGGFKDNGGNASAVVIGDKDLATTVGAGGLGGSFTVDSDTEITVTAGAGEVTRGTIVVKDGVGNPSVETFLKGTIDNTAPATPTIGLQDWNDYGYSNTDNWTNITHADFAVSNVVPGDSITVYMDGVAVMSEMTSGGTSTTTRDLQWHSDETINWDELSAGIGGITGGDGNYTFTAIATDSAGNASTAGSMTYKLDTTAPDAPVLESFSSSASAVGVDESGTDRITNDNTPSVRVSNITVGNGISLYYYLRGNAINDLEWVQFDLASDTLTTSPFDAQFVGTEEKTWGDQTQAVLAALPDSSDNVGDYKYHEYLIYGHQTDSAGNSSSSGTSTFYIDTKEPQATLSYSTVNALSTLAEDPDSLMRFEDGQLTIKATFTDASGNPDGMNNTTPPTVTVDLPETTDDDFANTAMTVDPANDHIWTYTFTPPDGIDGTGTVTVNGTDNAGNALVTASTVGSELMVFDNTDPNPFTVADVTPLGKYPKTKYFNIGTDSVSVVVPMDASDITLNGGQVKLKMQIVGAEATLTQVDTTVKIVNYIDPLTIVTKKDSIRRNFTTSVGPPWAGEKLGQGDRLFTIAERFDKAGNSRIGIASLDTLLIDTIPPVKGTWLIDMSGTTLTSTDTIIASVTGFSEALSAVDSYDWAVGKFKKTVNVLGDSVNVLTKLDSIGAWTTSDSTINGKAPLRDSTMHRLNVRALDEAGNISDTLYTDPGIWRLNSSPTIKTLGIVEVKEEDSLSFVVSDSVSDLDLATLLSDSLKYLFLQSDGTTTSHLFSVKPQNALLSTTPDTILTIDSTTGLITWAAPWHGDTTNYNVTLKIFSSEDADSTANKWDRSITENFILRVNENYVPRIAKMIYKNMAGQMDTLVTVPDTLKMWENDTITVTFSLSDLDDDTLISYGIIADSVQLALSTTDTAGSILPKDIQTTFTPDSAWDNMSKVTLSLSDGIVKDTLRTIKTKFILNVIHVPRPNFKMIMGQNPTFTRYYELMVTDTAEKAKNLSVYIYENLIEPQGEAKMDSMGNFTWVGNFEFDTTANYRIEMKGDGLQVGDTTIYDTVAHAIARAAGPWRAETYDGGFTVISKSANSVPFDKPFMIVDSLLFPLGEGEGGLYRMGHPLVEFEKSVMVTILADKRFPAEDQAIHQMFGGVWQELPTIHRKNEIMAWTNAMGYFKIGDKTIIVPEETLLGTNYPNPFNSSTNVEFDVGFFGGPNQRISVEVFNILGQKIKTLHKGPLAIGHHKLRWDARDMNESPVSSGVYVIRLLSDAGVSKSKKMTLLR
jgi:hypothetical protein